MGLDAETVARRCHFKHKGYRVLTQEEFMARKAKQGGPSLFGDDDQAVGLDAYGKPARGLRADPDRTLGDQAEDYAIYGAEAMGAAGGVGPRRPADRLGPLRGAARAVAFEVVRQAREDAQAEVGRQLDPAGDGRPAGDRRTGQGAPCYGGGPPGVAEQENTRRALAILRECLIPETDSAQSATA